MQGGVQKIVTLVEPLVSKEDPALIKTVNDNFATVDTIPAKYKTADGFETYDKLLGAIFRP